MSLTSTILSAGGTSRLRPSSCESHPTPAPHLATRQHLIRRVPLHAATQPCEKLRFKTTNRSPLLKTERTYCEAYPSGLSRSFPLEPTGRNIAASTEYAAESALQCTPCALAVHDCLFYRQHFTNAFARASVPTDDSSLETLSISSDPPNPDYAKTKPGRKIVSCFLAHRPSSHQRPPTWGEPLPKSRPFLRPPSANGPGTAKRRSSLQ